MFKQRLSIKLFTTISFALIISFTSTYFVYNNFAQKYLIEKYYKNLKQVRDEIEAQDLNIYENKDVALEKKAELMKKYNVIITWFYYTEEEEYFNILLRKALNLEKISLAKVWLVKERIEQLQDGKPLRMNYIQGKMKLSFLTLFVKKGDIVIVIGQSIPHSDDIVEVFNEINFILWITTLVLVMIFIWWYSRKITKPLEMLKEKSYEIANQNFSEIKIKTGDEIEELASSINKMSSRLSDTLNELDQKNQSLKRFVSDASHELKTPLTIIKAYAHGIEDDIDDGTYLSGIKKQTLEMSNLVTNLLEISKSDHEPLAITKVDVNMLIKEVLLEYRIILDDKKIELIYSEESQLKINADYEKIKTVLKNIIGNAIKYNSDNKVSILISNNNKSLVVENTTSAKLDKAKIELLFAPFYTIDESRNKEISGSGLGLAIVKSILDKHQFRYKLDIINYKFRFEINFKHI